MLDVVRYLFNEIGDDSYHELVTVSNKAINSAGQFEAFISHTDDLDIERLIIDDIVTYKAVDKKNKCIYYGFTLLEGDDLECLVFEDMTEDDLIVTTEYNKGITFSRTYKHGNTGRNKIIGYVHRTKGKVVALDLNKSKIKKRFIKSILLVDDVKNIYLISLHNESSQVYDYYYIHVDTETNLISIVSSINFIIMNTLGIHENNIYNLAPITNDIFTYETIPFGQIRKRKELFSIKLKERLNYFDYDLDMVKLIVGDNENTYVKNGICILYKGIKEELEKVKINGKALQTGLDVDKEIHLLPLKPSNNSDLGKTVPLHDSLTHFFKNINGMEMFYSVILGDKSKGEKHKYIFFKIEDGELKTDMVEGSSAPTNIYVNKELCTITLVYDLQGFYQHVTYFENGLVLYKYSFVEITPDPEINLDMELTKYKEHLDSFVLDTNVSKDEYTNLLHFKNMAKGIGREGGLALVSHQFSNMNTGEIDFDIKRIYMSLNGRIQMYKKVDGTVTEKILVRKENLEERSKIETELDNDVIEKLTNSGDLK